MNSRLSNPKESFSRMKKIYSLISLSAILVATSCSDSNDPRVPETVPGQDVVFQAIMPASTRTAYGDLGTTSRPVYWSNGDLIQVASAQCEAGFDNATYRVEVKDAAQNYADRLVHNDPAGVRWGDETDYTKYKFFAIYPQAPLTLSGENDEAVAEAAVYFSAEQNSVMTKVGDAWKPSTYDMDNNIMYAQPIKGQNQVQVNETTGETVANLQFNPFSTVLHLNFAGWKTDNTAATEGFTIFSVTVQSAGTAPIAGNFPLTMHGDGSTPTLGVAKGDAAASSSVKVNLNQSETLNGFLPAAGETYECDIFMAPRSGQKIGQGWKIVLETSAGNWEFDLSKATADSNLTLAPGAIHILNIPELSIEKGWEYTPNAWLADIPDNVYWSEVSLPGSWYSASNTNKDLYQNGTIAQQFAAGVRAFHLETKVGYRTFSDSDTRNVVISGTGRKQTTNIGVPSGSYVDATPIAATVDEIAKQLTSKSEFAVLTLSYADEGSAGISDTDLADWLELVTKTFDSKNTTNTGWPLYREQFNAISSETQAKLYTGSLSTDTPVSALRGKLLVLLNVQTQNTASTGYTPGNFLYAYTHSNWTETASQVSQAYWKTWSNEYLTSASGKAWEQNPNSLYFNYTFANRTQLDSGTEADLPTYAKRKEAIQSIITRSKKMRGDGRHNILFFIGAGGTEAITSSGDATDNGPTLVADQLNGYLLGEINKKIEAGEASPLGLVYTNFTTGTSGQQVVDAIIRMNRRFKLLEIGGTQGGGTGTQTNIKSVIPTHSSGYNKAAGNGWNAF